MTASTLHGALPATSGCQQPLSHRVKVHTPQPPSTRKNESNPLSMSMLRDSTCLLRFLPAKEV